jgi:hypothetical protein
MTVQWYPARPGLDYNTCILCRDEAVKALRSVVNSGVSAYSVGSRGLTRLSISDLQGLIAFWTNAANDALLGFSSSIQCRRGVPCDV